MSSHVYSQVTVCSVSVSSVTPVLFSEGRVHKQGLEFTPQNKIVI